MPLRHIVPVRHHKRGERAEHLVMVGAFRAGFHLPLLAPGRAGPASGLAAADGITRHHRRPHPDHPQATLTYAIARRRPSDRSPPIQARGQRTNQIPVAGVLIDQAVRASTVWGNRAPTKMLRQQSGMRDRFCLALEDRHA